MFKRSLKLYSGPQCGLCDQALAIIASRLGEEWQLEVVDITTSLELKKNYGLRIPVVERMDNGDRLFWPFNEKDVEQLLDA